MHTGSMVDLNDNRTTVAVDPSTCGDQTKMANSMVSDAVKIHILVSSGNGVHVGTRNGSVGTSVNETAFSPGVLSPMVADRVLVWGWGAILSGRCHLLRLARHPANMAGFPGGFRAGSISGRERSP